MIELDPNKDKHLQIAELELKAAEEAVLCAEEELRVAARNAVLAQGKVYYHTFKPKRHEVLNPSTQVTPDHLYALCMQLGYRFAMLNDTVHFAGKPGEQLVNTGFKLMELPA